MGKKRKSAANNNKPQSSTTTTTASVSSKHAQNRNKSFHFPVDSLLPPASTSTKGKPQHDLQQSSFSSSLIELYSERVWVIRNFLSMKECNAFINVCEASTSEHHFEYTNLRATKYTAHRECYRLQQPDAYELAARLYERLINSNTAIQDLQNQLKVFHKKRPAYKPVGFNPNVRLYKYTKGHSFGKHIDESNKVDGVGTTEITILVYLSRCTGGATRFYPPVCSSSKHKQNSISFDPEPGTMLLHVHGSECLEHEADPVLDGIKYVLRTDLVFDYDKQKHN